MQLKRRVMGDGCEGKKRVRNAVVIECICLTIGFRNLGSADSPLLPHSNGAAGRGKSGTAHSCSQLLDRSHDRFPSAA